MPRQMKPQNECSQWLAGKIKHHIEGIKQEASSCLLPARQTHTHTQAQGSDVAVFKAFFLTALNNSPPQLPPAHPLQ